MSLRTTLRLGSPLAAALRRQPVRTLAAVTTGVDRNLGRTPERTAELEALAEEHNGFLFGEVPLKEGEKREWEDWEYSYVPLMSSAFIIYGLAFYYRPKGSALDVAREEALRRMATEEEEE